MSETLPEIGAVANWFGRDGAVIDRVAELLDGCRWIGVPFAGGMGVLAALRCNQGVASDLHCHVVNLAAVMSQPELVEQFAERLAAVPLHTVVLQHAQARCAAYVREHEELAASSRSQLFSAHGDPYDCKPGARFLKTVADVGWAVDYFIVSWMSRAGQSGTDTEFDWSEISVRWKATGGSSSSRWRTAVASIPGWHDVLKRWSFVCMDAFEFLDQCLKVEKKTAGALSNGLYLDPPFPDAGEPYTHSFSRDDQVQLARVLAQFKKTRIVVRYHEHPLIRELYGDGRWGVVELEGRAQTNEARQEFLLILNGEAR